MTDLLRTAHEWRRSLRIRLFWRELWRAWRVAAPACLAYDLVWLVLPVPGPRWCFAAALLAGPSWAIWRTHRRGPDRTAAVYLVDRARGWQENVLTALDVAGQPAPEDPAARLYQRATALVRHQARPPGRMRWTMPAAAGCLLLIGWWCAPTVATPTMRAGARAVPVTAPVASPEELGYARTEEQGRTPELAPDRRGAVLDRRYHRIVQDLPDKDASSLARKLGLLKQSLSRVVPLRAGSPPTASDIRATQQDRGRSATAGAQRVLAAEPGRTRLEQGRETQTRLGPDDQSQGEQGRGSGGENARQPSQSKEESAAQHGRKDGQKDRPSREEGAGKGTEAARGRTGVTPGDLLTPQRTTSGKVFQLSSPRKGQGLVSLAAKARTDLPLGAAMSYYRRQVEETLATEIYPGPLQDEIEAYFASWD